MTTKYGDFVEPNFNCRGDPYEDKAKPSDRDTGLAFIATAGKRGKNNDATFDHKFKTLYEGEKYTDPSRQRLQANAEKKKGMVTDVAFKRPSPMKKSACVSDYYGTFGGKVEYIAGSPEVRLLKGQYPELKANFYTSPAKKGSYGYIKTTLSEQKAAGGLVGEYTYTADPYDAAKVQALAEKKAHPNISEAPFRPSHPARKGSYGYIKTNVGNTAKGSMGEYAYLPQGDGGPRQVSTKFEIPFVPSAVPKKGHNCTLSKRAPYEADPDQIKLDARRLARKMEIDAMTSSNAWRPANIPKTAATRSVMRMNL